MDKNTKTVTAKEFAIILQKAFRRYTVRIPGDQYYDSPDAMYSIIGTFARKLDKKIHITEESDITEDLIRSVIKAYDDKQEVNLTNRWYNTSKKMAWEAACNKAYRQIPMPVPEKLPISVLSKELDYYRDCYASGAFRDVLSRAGMANLGAYISENEMVRAMKYANESHDGQLLDALSKIYTNHFEFDMEKAEVIEAKEILMEDETEMENEKTEDEGKKIIDSLVENVIRQLKMIAESETFTFDDDEKKAICEAVGANKEIESLKFRINELEIANAQLRAKADKNRETFDALKRILDVISRTSGEAMAV